jgi:hypothetical protein
MSGATVMSDDRRRSSRVSLVAVQSKNRGEEPRLSVATGAPRIWETTNVKRERFHDTKTRFGQKTIPL